MWQEIPLEALGTLKERHSSCQYSDNVDLCLFSQMCLSQCMLCGENFGGEWLPLSIEGAGKGAISSAQFV